MRDGTRIENQTPSAGPQQQPLASGLRSLPNAITFARLCAVPLTVWLVLQHRTGWAFALFLLAGVSDAVDGWLARRLGPTQVGALLDPVADKALLMTMYVTLAAVNILPDWLAIMVVFRDVLIVGGVLALAVLGHDVAIRPLYVSKLNTVLQIVLVTLALGLAGFGLTVPPPLMTGLIWLVAASTLASGAAYVHRATRTV